MMSELFCCWTVCGVGADHLLNPRTNITSFVFQAVNGKNWVPDKC